MLIQLTDQNREKYQTKRQAVNRRWEISLSRWFQRGKRGEREREREIPTVTLREEGSSVCEVVEAVQHVSLFLNRVWPNPKRGPIYHFGPKYKFHHDPAHLKFLKVNPVTLPDGPSYFAYVTAIRPYNYIIYNINSN